MVATSTAEVPVAYRKKSEHPPLVFGVNALGTMMDRLNAEGFTVVGPTTREGAIVYDEIHRLEDLPAGWKDETERGTYRLIKRDDAALFGFTVSPVPWKRFLLPPEKVLWRARLNPDDSKFTIEAEPDPPQQLALFGIHPCDLAALQILDQVLLGGPFVDPEYQARRAKALTIVVNCSEASPTCFCASVDSGPRATTGFDIALTEILEKGRHEFVVEIGSDAGAALLSDIDSRPAEDEDLQRARQVTDRTRSTLKRSLDVSGIGDLLFENLDHPRWEQVANRCLACGNCTLSCPTCFCTTIEDKTNLTGKVSERWQKWDSCFTIDFSYIHGGSVRNSTRARYRQWLTHKFASWQKQFGTLGCVGCGRCIVWCPVGIDITEELQAIRENTHYNNTRANAKD